MAALSTGRQNWLDGQARRLPDTRKAAELPWQERAARQWREAEATLFDCQFLFAKVAANMVLDLDLDYETLLRNAPDSELRNCHGLRLIHGALQLSIHVVAKDPRQFASQMVGRLLPHEEKTAINFFMVEITKNAPRPWLRPQHPALATPGGPLIRTLVGHSEPVTAVAVLPDGLHALSASWDKTLKVWDLQTGLVLSTLEGHYGDVRALAVTRDGKRAISGAYWGDLIVWDLGTGFAQNKLKGRDHDVYFLNVNGVAAMPCGKRAISAYSDHTLKLWDLETGEVLKTLKDHSGSVDAVAMLPDGRRALSASHDKTLKLWDLETGEVLKTLNGHSDGVRAVALFPDCRRAISGSSDKTLKVWDLKKGRVLQTLKGHDGNVNGVAVMPDGKQAVSASDDKTLKVWDLRSGRALRTLEGHDAWVTGVAVTPDGRLALSASFDKTLKVWELEGGPAVDTLEGQSDWARALADIMRVSAVTPDGSRMVSASDDMTLKVWDLKRGRVLRTLEGHSALVTAIAVLPDGLRALSASRDGILRVWDLETGQCLSMQKKPKGWVKFVAVTPDCKRAVSATMEGMLEVWNLETGRCLRTLQTPSGQVDDIAVIPNGKRAVSASTDNAVRLWDLETGAEVAAFTCDASPLLCTCIDTSIVVVLDLLYRLHLLVLNEFEYTGSREGNIEPHLTRNRADVEPTPKQECENRDAGGPQMELDDHLVELADDLLPAFVTWLGFAIIGLFSLPGDWLFRAAFGGFYASMLAYPVFCVGLWRFMAPALHEGKERILAAIGLALSAPILWAVQLIFRPVDWAWSVLWLEGGQHPLLNMSRPFLFLVLITFLGPFLLRIRSRSTKVGILVALLLICFFSPSLSTALALNIVLAWLSTRILLRRFWAKVNKSLARVK